MSTSEKEIARYTWLTTEAFAAMAGGVSRTTVRQWIRGNRLRALNIGTETRPIYRIKREWADEWMERHAA